jgi:A/G-specific adenine glycosylase
VLPVQHDLIEWWSRAGRDLPWRRSRDPWAVLVSELMLQQTQVARVVDRHPRFLQRFPTVEACAAAPVGDVIDEWAGLGYNRRAVHLHRTATRCVEEHGGALPDTLDALLALPGIGPYTARAVLVFAHEHDIGLVDTNAGRFVARALAGRPLRPGEAQEVADAAVPAGWGWTWGQAVFDLGASVCRKRSPALRRLPRPVPLLLGPGRLPRPRPHRRLGRHQRAPAALRGLGPPGPRAAGGRAATRRGLPPRPRHGDGVAG